MKVYEFEAKILQPDDKVGAYIEFPYNLEDEFSRIGWIRVVATFDGFEYRGALANMGMGCHILIVPKKIRAEIGKKHGDLIKVTIVEDTEPRIIEVPDDFNELLSINEGAKIEFDKLSYTKRKDIIDSINDAKKEETRERRKLKAIEKLLGDNK